MNLPGLSNEQQARLYEVAQTLGVSPKELTSRAVEELLANPDLLEELEDIRAYDVATAPGGPLLSLAELLAQLDPPEAAYLQAALKRATYEELDNGTIYGVVPGLQGVWANEATQALCRDELASVLHGWIMLHRRDGTPIPPLDGIDLNQAAA